MKVILTESVEKLGQEGEVKEVANGYARNFLFPRSLAIPATAGSLKQADARRTHATRQLARVVTEAEKQAAQLNGLDVILFARVGEQNRLYGSVTAADVATALREQHHVAVDRRKITLDNPVHRTGNYTATVNLGRNVTAKITAVVESEANKEQVLAARREAAAARAAAAAEAAAPTPAPEAAAPSNPLEAVASAAGTAAATVADTAGTVVHNIADAAAPVVQNITEAAAPIVQNVAEGAGNVAQAVTSGIGALVSRVTGQTDEAAAVDTVEASTTSSESEITDTVAPEASVEPITIVPDSAADTTAPDTAAAAAPTSDAEPDAESTKSEA